MIRPRCVSKGGLIKIQYTYMKIKKLKGIILNSQRINKILKFFKIGGKWINPNCYFKKCSVCTWFSELIFILSHVLFKMINSLFLYT